MTKGSWIHDEVSRHFKGCEQCRAANPEAARTNQPCMTCGHTVEWHDQHRPRHRLKREVPQAVLDALCPDGRALYRMYLQWLASDDD